MSLSEAVVLDEDIDYTPMKNKEPLADQYDAGVTAAKPFFIKHYEKINGRNRLKYWYFNHLGVLKPKAEYKFIKAKSRRGVVVEGFPS